MGINILIYLVCVDVHVDSLKAAECEMTSRGNSRVTVMRSVCPCATALKGLKVGGAEQRCVTKLRWPTAWWVCHMGNVLTNIRTDDGIFHKEGKRWTRRFHWSPKAFVSTPFCLDVIHHQNGMSVSFAYTKVGNYAGLARMKKHNCLIPVWKPTVIQNKPLGNKL